MPLFRQLLLKDSISINTAPEKIWDFFTTLDKNYTIWHPEDHIVFKWIKGKPLEQGSKCYAEQYVTGKATKYNATLSEIIPHKKIVFKWSYPVSLMSPKVEWLIEPKGSHSVFTAITYIRAGHLLSKLFKKEMKKMVEAHNKHTWEEAKNLKKILERD